MLENNIGNVLWKMMPQWQKEMWEIDVAASELTSRAPGKYETMLDVMRIVSWFNPLDRFFPSSQPEGIYPGFDLMYHPFRIIDDVADGDRPLPDGYENFIEWRIHLEEIVMSDQPAQNWGHGIDFLVASSVAFLEKKQKGADSIRDDYLWFLAAMEAEYDRRVNSIVLSEEQLAELNWNSFGASFNITLMVMRSKYRAQDIRELSLLLSKAYAIRDLVDELPRMCNIPIEILEQGQISYTKLRLQPQLVNHIPALISWQQQEVHECIELIRILDEKKLDFPARLAVKFLSIGARRDIKKMQKAYLSENQEV